MIKKETSLDDILESIRDGFQEVEQNITDKLQQMDRKLDRIERIVNKWPPPSEIDRLFSRVNRIERALNLKPNRKGA